MISLNPTQRSLRPAFKRPFGSRLADRSGMTLIEIMIVIAIIGGLLAVLGTQAKNYLDKSKVENAKIQINELGKALDTYSLDCNGYPDDLNALLKSPGDACPNWGPKPYYSKKEIKDPWGRPFEYQKTGGGYIIRSRGRDGKEGGDGLDKDISSDELSGTGT